MINFFSKKTNFIDIWTGTPEMHCHVLPSIDDGAKDKDTSLQLINTYKSLGCPKIIATPHTMYGIYDNTFQSIEKAYNQISSNVNGIELAFSSEYMMDENFDSLLNTKQIIPLYKNFLLFELSYFQPPENLMEQIFKMGTLGYIPVLAHPERYAYYHRSIDIYKEFKSRGCLLQLNALSLTSHYGSECQKVAMKLLKDGLYDFIGLDTHHENHLLKIQTININKAYSNHLQRVCDKTTSTFM